MFEKLFVGVIITLLVIGIILQMNESPIAFTLLLLATCLCCFAYFLTLFRINKSLSFLLKDKYVSSINMLAAATAKIIQQEETTKLVIREMEKIGDGRSTDLSEKIDNCSGVALICLKEKLESYKKEEALRSWVVEGISLISELRKSINSIDEYSNQIITHIVKYLEASQGAFYLLREEEQVLELAARYAYGNRKHPNEKIAIGIGTGQLGQCIEQKDIIFLTNLPSNYIRITSGLGEATPTCILIAPLIFNNHVYGAIEVASFKILEEYQIDFLRKVCSNIAVEISAMIIHKNTEVLLKQAILAQEQMKQKEEQIRSKLDEVEAERSKNMAILNGCMDGVISFDEKGIIDFVNVAAAEIFNQSKEQLLGSDIQDLIAVHIVRGSQGVNKIISSSGNEITVRTEVTTIDNILSLLLTSTKVKMNEGYLFTLFIQKISVDLF